MKNFLLIFFVLIPFGLLAQPKTVDGIPFPPLTWQQAKNKAKVEGKYIFVDAYTSWCLPCKLMDLYVYSNDSIKELMKNRFISIKVQMDQNSDRDTTEDVYGMLLKNKYKIKVYPSYLFFTADGILVFRDYGYKSVKDFVEMDSIVLEPKRITYYDEISKYRKGVKNYSALAALAIFAKNVIQDEVLSNEIATDYKAHYFDWLDTSELWTSDRLLFVKEFPDLIKCRDRVFELAYKEPDKFNRMVKVEGLAESIVKQAVIREEIKDKISSMQQKQIKDEIWRVLRDSINSKYPDVGATRVILNYQTYYYRYEHVDWIGWAKAITRRIKLYPPKKEDAFWDLNLSAWDAFLNSNNKKVLRYALEWSNLSIKLDGDNPDVQSLDTKANLLYKLGRKKKAMAQEKMAIKTSNAIARRNREPKGAYIESFIKALSDMKDGKPTYVIEGAKWD